MDASLLSWKSFGNEYSLEAKQGGYEHSHWVTSILSIPKDSHPSFSNGGIITGCMDKSLRVYTSECILWNTSVSHTGGIISLAWTNKIGHVFLSGTCLIFKNEK